MTTPRLVALALNVADPDMLAAFYCGTLGMHRVDVEGVDVGSSVAVGYGGRGAALVLRAVGGGVGGGSNANDRYWKIAITVPDLDMAHARLRALRVAATQPHQFRQIAYMSHMSDPEGHVIELIQHTFEGKPRTAKGDAARPLGGGAQIGLITLRTGDIERELAHCRDTLGMGYLSRQTVEDRGFDLYFLGYADGAPPNPDVNAVENREWLWQRPCTALEFQHRLNSSDIRFKPADAPGAAAVWIDTADGGRTTLS